MNEAVEDYEKYKALTTDDYLISYWLGKREAFTFILKELQAIIEAKAMPK